MFEVKSYIGTYDKNEFYMVMGKYFAERVYRKRLPYLVNDKDKIWHLFYQGDELVGFAGLKLTKTATNITDIFYIETESEIGLLEFMINFIVETYKNEIIKVLSKDEYEINTFKDFKFKPIGNRGSYVNLELGGKDEERNSTSGIRC